ncbi:hypothetical protein J4558_24155 [Leptolyngbya sp. 15MV]|nr:hypothetical protein J4558_24155 [Leptolyngbya sp. 15MV]
MRNLLFALTLLAPPALAQTIHLGEVERWFLVLAPLHDARACIPDGDALRPGLEAMLLDVQVRSARAITSEYERGLLAGRLAEHTARMTPLPEDEACQRILAQIARGLLRVQPR